MPIVTTNSSPSGRSKRVKAPAASGGSATPFFTEDFAGGTTSDTGGFVWTLGAAVSVSSDRAYSGTHSLKFAHPATALESNGEQGGFEANFVLGRKCATFALEYQLFVPSNYYHRVNAGPLTNNNKFMSLYDASYTADSGNYRILFQSWEANIYGGLLGDSVSDCLYSGYDQQYMTYLNYGSDEHMIRDAGPMTRNAWSRVRVRVAAASGPGAADGRIEVWFNDTKRHEYTDVQLWTNPIGTGITGAPGIAKGYLMGSVNSGYTEATNFYIDELKFYDTDPGWV